MPPRQQRKTRTNAVIAGAVFGVAEPTQAIGTAAIVDESDEKPPRADVAAAEQMSELLRGFKERAKRENERMQLAVDGDYYAVIVFPTGEHRDAFVKAKMLQPLYFDGDCSYLDGMEIARLAGVELPPVPDGYRPRLTVENTDRWSEFGVIGE